MKIALMIVLLGLNLGITQAALAEEKLPRQLKASETYDLGELPKGQNGGPTFHGLVLNKKSLTQLWKAWERDPAEQPEIDFEKQMLYVAAQDTGDPNHQWHSFKLDAEGTLEVVTASTLIGGGENTGIYRATLLLLDRTGVKAVKVWVGDISTGSDQAIPLPAEAMPFVPSSEQPE